MMREKVKRAYETETGEIQFGEALGAGISAAVRALHCSCVEGGDGFLYSASGGAEHRF